MTNTTNDERVDERPRAPRAFWEPIERAAGDRGKFREHLMSMTRDALIEMYRTYEMLALELFGDEHLAHLEDDEDVIKDVAAWVVMQGEAYYDDVYEHPERTPEWSSIEGPSFSDEIVGVFAERFNEWISVAAQSK